MCGLIYKCTNIQNNKCYIGQTKNLKNRISVHFYDAYKKKLSTYFCRSLRKYGKENFKWEILGYCNSKKKLNEAEIECIRFFQSTNNLYGYNLTMGGVGGDTWTNNPNKKEIIKKIKIKVSKPKTKQARKNIALANIKKGKKRKNKTYEEFYGIEKATKLKYNQSLNNKGNKNGNAKKYILISPNGEKIFLYGNFVKFCEKNNLHRKELKRIADGTSNKNNWKGWGCKHAD